MKVFANTKISLVILPFLLTGCALNPNVLSLSDADAERQRLILNRKQPDEYPAFTFIQPQNKKEKCELAINPEALINKNFNLYWDGNCQRGFANGLGRIILRSDTEDIDTVTVLNYDSKKSIHRITFNYSKHQISFYEIDPLGQGPVLGLSHEFEIQNGEIKQHKIASGYFDLPKHQFYTFEASAINPYSVSGALKDGVMYVFENYEKIPLSQTNQVAERWVLVDRENNHRRVGVGLERLRVSNKVYAIQHLNTGTKQVTVPDEYFQPFVDIRNELQQHLNKSQNAQKMAYQILDKYKSRVCGKKISKIPKGLSKEDFYKVCDFDTTLVHKLKQAVVKYNEEMEKAEQLALVKLQQNQQVELHQQRIATYKAQQDAAIRTARAAESQAISASIQASAAQRQANAAEQQVNALSKPTTCTYVGNSMTCY